MSATDPSSAAGVPASSVQPLRPHQQSHKHPEQHLHQPQHQPRLQQAAPHVQSAPRGWAKWGQHFGSGNDAASNGRRAVLHRSEITREGWLWVRTPAQSWRRRWVVLDSFWLHSFPSNKAAAGTSVASHDFLAVFQAQINTFPEHVYAGVRDDRKAPAFSFGMVEAENPDYLHVFEAHSEEDRTGWIEALKIRAAFFIGERGFDQVHPRSIHEGFLSKTGGSNKRFRRRYVVLLSDRLLYFRKKGDAKCAGSVELSSRSLVTPEDGNQFSVASERNSRHFLFLAGNSEEAAAWIQLLKDRVRQLGSPAPPGPRPRMDPCQSVPVTPVHRGESRIAATPAAGGPGGASLAVGPSPSHLRRGSDSMALSSGLLPPQTHGTSASATVAHHHAQQQPQLPRLSVVLPSGAAGGGDGAPNSTTSAGSSRRFLFGRRSSTPSVDMQSFARASLPPPSSVTSRRLQAPAHLPVASLTPASRSQQQAGQRRTSGVANAGAAGVGGRERSLTADSQLQLSLNMGDSPSEIISLQWGGGRRVGSSADGSLESPSGRWEHARMASGFSLSSSPTAETGLATREPTEDSLSDSGTGTGEEYLRQVVAGVDVHLGRSLAPSASSQAAVCAFPDCDSAAHEGHPYCATHSFLSLSGGFRGGDDGSSTDTEDTTDHGSSQDSEDEQPTSAGEDTPRGFYRGSRSGSFRGGTGSNRLSFMHTMSRAFEAADRRESLFPPGGRSGAPSVYMGDLEESPRAPLRLAAALMNSSRSESSLNVLRTLSGSHQGGSGGRLERQEGDEDHPASPVSGTLSHSPSLYHVGSSGGAIRSAVDHAHGHAGGHGGGVGDHASTASHFRVSEQQLGIGPEEAQFMAAMGSQRGQETPTPVLRQRMLDGDSGMGSPAAATRSVAAEDTPPRVPAAAAAALAGSSPPRLVGHHLHYFSGASPKEPPSAGASAGNRTPPAMPRSLPAELLDLPMDNLELGHEAAASGPAGTQLWPARSRPRHYKSESMGSRFSAATGLVDAEASSSSTDSLVDDDDLDRIEVGAEVVEDDAGNSSNALGAAAGVEAEVNGQPGGVPAGQPDEEAEDADRSCFSCNRFFAVHDLLVEVVCSSCQQTVCNQCCGVSPAVARQGAHTFSCHECDNPLNNLIQMF